MRHKSILEQVEEQENRRKESEEFDRSVSKIFKIAAIVFVATILGVGIFIYQYFQPTEEELAIKAEQKKANILYNYLVVGCENLIRENLNYPSTYKMRSKGVRSLDEGVYIDISFTAKNAFGAELPQSGQCIGTGNGIILIDIKNR